MLLFIYTLILIFYFDNYIFLPFCLHLNYNFRTQRDSLNNPSSQRFFVLKPPVIPNVSVILT